jgi:hypothetical protein
MIPKKVKMKDDINSESANDKNNDNKNNKRIKELKNNIFKSNKICYGKKKKS